MTTVTGLTAERMLLIEGESVVDGQVVSGSLILTKRDGTTINAGSVAGPAGPTGPTGPATISSIPGEVRIWPNTVLPLLATYGKWVWADGAAYASATYPLAAGNIAAAWKTAHGQADPGAGQFRVPDFRGLVPAGLDAMPGGSRANRMTRTVAITIAGKTGEETHVITVAEMPAHDHPFRAQNISLTPGGDSYTFFPRDAPVPRDDLIDDRGGGLAHENVQPTVMVPYIVSLGG